MDIDYLQQPIDTPEAYRDALAQHAEWLAGRSAAFGRLEQLQNDLDNEALRGTAAEMNSLMMYRLDVARMQLEAAGHDLSSLATNGAQLGEITPETRAALGAALGGPNGQSAERNKWGVPQTRREQLARAYVQAAAGDSSGLADLHVDHRRDGTATLVPMQARAVTGTADIPDYVDAGPTFGLVRPGSMLDLLGIYPHMMMEGQTEFGWLKTAPAAVHAAEDADLGALTAGQTAWSTATMSPERFHDVRGVTVESEARWSGSYAELIDDMMANVSDKMESAILAGTGVVAAPDGLAWTGINSRSAEGRAVSGTADTYDTAVKAIASEVDGKFAMRTEDLRAVMASDMHAHLAGLIHAGSGRSVIDWIAENLGGYAVSDHWPDIDNGTGGILIRRGMRDGAVAWVVWANLRLIGDNVTAAGVGTKLVGWALADLYVPNAATDKRGDFERVSIQTA